MSGSLEGNKIAAAIILAGLVGMGSGLISRVAIHSNVPETPAYAIEVPESGATQVAAAEEPAGPEPISALLASADVAAGEKAFRACASCHSWEEGGAHKVGPNLWDIVGHEKSAMDGFTRYSGALAADDAWTYENLNAFLYDPKAYAPGTTMGYRGMKKTSDRANLIAWLRTHSADPVPLP
ncbi:MAG: cytochrome c family protein [Alphaproteobacteria bacterium]|nr:cytochrome c family protein [Alphaproteobacteria bacterium]